MGATAHIRSLRHPALNQPPLQRATGPTTTADDRHFWGGPAVTNATTRLRHQHTYSAASECP